MKTLSLTEMESVQGGSCGRAVAGTIITTAILIGVSWGSGGLALPAALGFFAAKGWNTYNIIASCRGY